MGATYPPQLARCGVCGLPLKNGKCPYCAQQAEADLAEDDKLLERLRRLAKAGKLVDLLKGAI